MVLAAPFALAESALETIEKKGIYHYHPGSRVLALGGWGCNLHCHHCRNHTLACRCQAPVGPPLPPAEALVPWAQSQACDGLAWGFTEPTLWYERLVALSEDARALGLFSLVCTNGLSTPAILRRLVASGVNLWKVDLKGFSAAAYRQVTGFDGWRGILDNLVWLRGSGGHLELSWCPLPGMDKVRQQARDLGNWVREHLGADTPLHLNAFFPAYRRLELPFGDMAWLRQLRDDLGETGLRYLYLPQSLRLEERTTHCASCGAVLVERPAIGTPRLYLEANHRCAVCGNPAPLLIG